MKAMKFVWGATAAVALLSGCASSVNLDEEAPVESRTPTDVSSTAATDADGAMTGQAHTAYSASKSLDSASSVLPRVIYFDFDSYVIKDEFRGIVDGHAKLLAAERKKHLTIEGHADERGGREYNLALGQKRAEAVLKALVLLGASDTQLEAVSYGKERPAALGSNEVAYSKNRRAELNMR